MNYDAVLRQHVEDAALHWVAFQDTCDTQPRDHPDIRYYGKRLEPHLRGLGLALEQAWPIARDTVLENPNDADAVFVAMWIALKCGMPKRIQQMATCVASRPETAAGALGAVQWTTVPEMAPFVQNWVHGDDPVLRAMGLRSCLLHGSVPSHLHADLRHASPLVRSEAMALSAARAPDLFRDNLKECLIDPDVPSRLTAALRAAELGHHRAAIQTLVDIAQTTDACAALARDWAAAAMPTDTLAEWAREVRTNDVLVTRLVGLAGVENYWPWLIERMGDPATSVASGLAARDLSGQDLSDPVLFHDDTDTLPSALKTLDPDAADIPNADQFQKALDAGLLSVPKDHEALSARAQMLNGMRRRAALWPTSPTGSV